MSAVYETASALVSISPTTGEELERFELMSEAELERALSNAVTAQRAWRHLAVAERCEAMQRLAAVMRSESERLASLLTREMGKPISEAKAEVEKCASTAEWMAEHAEEMLAAVALDGSPANAQASFRPLGIVFAIMPWNYPLWQVMRAAIPALLAGNGVVLKHAPNVTRSALVAQELFVQADFPHGLFRTLLIDTSSAASVIADRRVAGVTLTGSVRAGEAVGAAAGGALKKVVLELGGSDPFIVLNDAALDSAIAAAVRARFQNNGQSCIAAKRFIVESGVAETFIDGFAQAVAALRVGDPADPSTQIGPLARADLRDALQSQLERALGLGAVSRTGRGSLPGCGWFFEPTVLTGVGPKSPIFQEETFGPLTGVAVVADREAAIELANDSDFGLGSSIWTADRRGAAEMAERLEAGMVFVNGIVASDPRLPFGGVKRSGLGRELSVFGIREFVNVQLFSAVDAFPSPDCRENGPGRDSSPGGPTGRQNPGSADGRCLGGRSGPGTG